MFSISLEFSDEQSMRAMADRLWRQYRITGEMQMKKLDDVWRLEIHAEKQPPAKVLEQLKSQQVQFEIDV